MAQDFSLAQLELFAELEAIVIIIPSFEDEQLFLLSGETQNFKPNQ